MLKLTEEWQKATATRPDRVFLGALSILLILVGFLVGYWTAETQKTSPIIFSGNNVSPQILSDTTIAQLNDAVQTTNIASVAASSSQPVPSVTAVSNNYVASLSGAKYYFTTCAEVKRIKEENQVFFKTEQEATDAGYEPSACVLKNK